MTVSSGLASETVQTLSGSQIAHTIVYVVEVALRLIRVTHDQHAALAVAVLLLREDKRDFKKKTAKYVPGSASATNKYRLGHQP